LVHAFLLVFNFLSSACLPALRLAKVLKPLQFFIVWVNWFCGTRLPAIVFWCFADEEIVLAGGEVFAARLRRELY